MKHLVIMGIALANIAFCLSGPLSTGQAFASIALSTLLIAGALLNIRMDKK